MQIGFILEENEHKVTPMKVADALISSDQFNWKEIKEIVAYLSVYTSYHKEERK